jgi:hypothetical protein
MACASKFVGCVAFHLLYEFWKGEMCENFRSENLKGRNHSEDLDVDGRIILRLDLKEIG